MVGLQKVPAVSKEEKSSIRAESIDTIAKTNLDYRHLRTPPMQPVYIPCRLQDTILYVQSQVSLLYLLLVALDLITNLEISPRFEAQTTLASFFHLLYIFLDVLQRSQGACMTLEFYLAYIGD